ncbi:hypothetical protein [Rhizohabitans arisaemae]|uniref:hypothetical protein n=1 Tax=Rhizohabitans arisaemae TaxID=2720610 RepID=UPI0024B10B38|nr:hypothetical protein [Rhizohabitans arisaemae]
MRKRSIAFAVMMLSTGTVVPAPAAIARSQATAAPKAACADGAKFGERTVQGAPSGTPNVPDGTFIHGSAYVWRVQAVDVNRLIG